MNVGEYSLTDAAERLGVHYMTAYRYVRTGRVEAHQRGSQWVVRHEALERFMESTQSSRGNRRAPSRRNWPVVVEYLVARLISGDEEGAWQLVQEALAGGASPREVYLELFSPAMELIGERWTQGELTIAHEHRATVVMQRLVGRTGPLLRTRGPRIRSLVVGAPAGELHVLPLALAADLLRAEGFDVVDLGADVPAEAFIASVHSIDSARAVIISVTSAQHRHSVSTLIGDLRASDVRIPIIAGGAGLSETDALECGGDWWVPDVETLARQLHNT